MAAPYQFKESEEAVLALWKKEKLLDTLRKRNSKGKPFYFLQGPPYTSGRLHIAHAWNNALKDIVLRYKRMQGFNVWDRAGYDMHGLPTENKVQDKLKLKYKEDIIIHGMEPFIEECRKFCVDNAKLMDQDLERLGVTMDFKNAYYPIDNEFIEGEWWFIKKAHEQNRLYKGKKIMHWCASCETSLAKHELEYENDTDTSIFLKFKVKNTPNEYLLVWTTTPWTIPYNLGVMVNPELEYVKVRVGGEFWILAKALAGVFIQSVMGLKLEIVDEFMGETLEGVHYEHPLEKELSEQYALIRKNSPKLHSVLLSTEYVDTTAGTGLVHCAPGCGPEDFEIGKKYGLPAFNHLNEKGQFEDMGPFNGWVAKTDDKKFIDHFKDIGCVLETTPVEHEYAHCWRCHKPVVFRATEQWFLKIEDLIPRMIELNKEVHWEPKFAAAQFDSWIAALKDNAISRQRFWGCPVPIWVNNDDPKDILVIGSVAELKKYAKNVPKDLHRPYIDEVVLEKNGKKYARVPDVIDVWIDSGTTSWNCLYFPSKKEYFDQLYPADFILEATEQIRLWFSMLLICSTIAFNKHCYKNVFCHGMILDYQGMKMSKSLGNIISPYEVIDKHGADILRYYMCQTRAGENINFSWDEVKQKQRNLTVLWNVHNFLMDYCADNEINPAKLDAKVMQTQLDTEEKYIMSLMHSTIQKVTELLDAYRIDEVIGEIESLFLALSRVYMQLTRDKASTGTVEEKEVVAYTIYTVLKNALLLFAPVAPFITETAHQNFNKAFGNAEKSVHMESWPVADVKLIDHELEQSMDTYLVAVQSILAAREKAQLGLRWPLKELIVVTKEAAVIKALETVEDLIKVQTNVKSIAIQPTLPGLKEKIMPNHGKLGPAFGELMPKIIAQLIVESSATILNHFAKDGKFVLTVDRKKVDLLPEHVTVQREVPAGFVQGEFKGGFVYLNVERTDELEAEGYAREIMRRIQAARKTAGLKKTDRISLFVQTEEEIAGQLKQFEPMMKEKVGAEHMKISHLGPGKEHVHSAVEKVKSIEFKIFFDVL